MPIIKILLSRYYKVPFSLAISIVTLLYSKHMLEVYSLACCAYYRLLKHILYLALTNPLIR